MSTIAIIDLGTAPNDGTGDPLRVGGQEINDNFANLNADKLEIGGYGGTAQDLANDIADRMLISTYDPNGVEANVFNALNIVTFTTYEVLQGSNVQTNLNSADSVFLDKAQTGVKYGYVIPDGALGVATTFDHENIVGEILDLSDPINPVYVRVNVPAATGINPIEGTIYYYVDKSSPTALSNTTVKPTNAQRRDRMYVFRVITNGGVILGIASERSKTQQTDNTLRELYEFLGNGRVSGLEPLPSGANLTFQVTSGQALGYDTSPNDYDNPNVRQIPNFDTNASSEFFEATSSGVDFTAKTTVNVDQYQDGTGTLVNAGVGNFTVWYVCQFFDSLNMILVPEDDDFNTAADGLLILSRQRIGTLAPAITQDAFCIGAIIAESGTTDLNDSSVLFIETNKLGDFGTGSFATSAPVGSYFEVANSLSEGDPIAIKTTLGLVNAALTDTTNTFTAVQTFNQIIQSSGIAVAGATVNDVLLGDGTYTPLSQVNTVNWDSITGDQKDVNLIGFTDGEAGGIEFSEGGLASVSASFDFLSSFAVNPNNNNILGVTIDSPTRVLRSTDFGVTWEVVIPTGVIVVAQGRTVRWLNDRFYILTGSSSPILETTDFGDTIVDASGNGTIPPAAGFDDAIYYPPTGEYFFIKTLDCYRTSDFITFASSNTGSISTGIATNGTDTIVVVGRGGDIVTVSTDGGLTWTAASAPSGAAYGVVYNPDNDTWGVALSDGGNLKIAVYSGDLSSFTLTSNSGGAVSATESKQIAYYNGAFYAFAASVLYSTIDGTTLVSLENTGVPATNDSINIYGTDNGVFLVTGQFSNAGSFNDWRYSSSIERRFENIVNEYRDFEGNPLPIVDKVLALPRGGLFIEDSAGFRTTYDAGPANHLAFGGITSSGVSRTVRFFGDNGTSEISFAGRSIYAFENNSLSNFDFRANNVFFDASLILDGDESVRTNDSTPFEFLNAIQLASFTTTEKNALAGIVNGCILFDSTLGKVQVYESGSWANVV